MLVTEESPKQLPSETRPPNCSLGGRCCTVLFQAMGCGLIAFFFLLLLMLDSSLLKTLACHVHRLHAESSTRQVHGMIRTVVEH